VNPSYEQVCGGGTGHVEVVRVSFDADRISLREVLEIFFPHPRPDDFHRQGNDIAPSTAAASTCMTRPRKRSCARWWRGQRRLRGRVVTEVLPLANYSRAEDYHQHYFARHPNQGYCAMVVAPKVDKFRRTFKARVKA